MSKRAGGFNYTNPNVRLAGWPFAQGPAGQPLPLQVLQAPAVTPPNRTQTDGMTPPNPPPDLPLASTGAQPALHGYHAAQGPGDEDPEKRDWSTWLRRAQALQAELAIWRAAWQKDSPALLTPLPIEVVARILTHVLCSSDYENDPRPLLRQLHAIGRINRSASAMKARLVAYLPKDLLVRAGLAEFAMLSPRLPGSLEQLSRFIAQRIGLDDPQWQQQVLPTDSEPRWGHTKSLLPDVSEQAKWRALIKLHPENLQELNVSVTTALEHETITTLAACTGLHTVRIEPVLQFPVLLNAPATLDQKRLDWLDSVPKLERIEALVPCLGFGWIPDQTRSKLKVLSLKEFICTPQALQELNNLPPDIEVELTVIHELGAVTPDTPLSGSITGFRYHAKLMQLELLRALPVTLRTLQMMADDAVLEEALDRFKDLTKLELLAPRDANLAPLRSFVSEACALRHLTVHVSSKEAKLLIDALVANRSLETIAIGALTTKPSLAALNKLIACHPMTNLIVWLGGDQATPERIRPMLKAVAASMTLRSFTLNANHGITAVLQEVVEEFKPEDCGLLDFSANFGKWSIRKRSLKFWESENPAPQTAPAAKKRRRKKKNS